jgi:hypothetical protein
MLRSSPTPGSGIVLLLLVAVATLTPMAYASPPDPSWIKGVYDDGDFDDVVMLVTSGTAMVELAPLSELQPVAPPGILIVQSIDRRAPELSPASLRPRAPPAL